MEVQIPEFREARVLAEQGARRIWSAQRRS
jgi:hypothetical protein